MSTKKPVVQPPWQKPAPPAGEKPVLRIYNSLTRSKDEFIPLVDNHISWYCCGPTVYNHAHMGHARNYVCSDICRRILQDYFGYNVTFVQNVTDIDDKIIIAARQQHLFEEKISGKYSEKTSELSTLVEGYLAQYVRKHLDSFSGDIKSDLATWIGSLDIQTLSAANPKLPMYTKAAGDAHRALYGDASPSDFVSLVEDVCVESLDAQYGASVTDPVVFRKLPAFWEDKFNSDMDKLNVLSPSVTTRVSEYVPEIVDFVARIISNGYGYSTGDGSVYFDTVAFENAPDHHYAKLQPWNKGSMELINDGEGSLSSGAGKKSPSDFALWKASKPGEPAWPSPWGEGRPGWHIECSVMASDILGEQIDIHSGGVDLCFPHHDNELAQAEACFESRQWINYFMHNGHLHIQGHKMSKSLKNFITVEEALQTHSARQLRLVFAFGAWDKPIDFKDSLVAEVRAYESSMAKFFTTVRALHADYTHAVAQGSHVSKKLGAGDKSLLADLSQAQTDVHAAFCDNLATPVVLRVLGDMVSRTNTHIQAEGASVRLEPVVAVTRWIVRMLEVLGFEARPDRLGWAEADADASSGAVSAEETAMPYVKTLSAFRDRVRELAIEKADPAAFLALSDAVRADLVQVGVSLDDRPGGALVKFLSDAEKAEFLRQQQARDQAAAEKAKKRGQQAKAAAEKERERVERLKVPPQQMFRDELLYSAWDDQGMPTVMVDGAEVTKSMRKKLAKQYQQQEKLHAEYLASGEGKEAK